MSKVADGIRCCVEQAVAYAKGGDWRTAAT